MKEAAKKHKLFSPKYFVYDFVKVTAGIPGLIWFRPKKLYASEKAKEKIKGGALLIANHSGFFDPVYLMLGIWYRRHHYVAWKLLFEGKFRHFLFTSFLCIPIDKEHFGIGTFREITNHLEEDELVVLFPEGKVNVTGKNDLQSFKSGMILMSARSGKPIVPIYIGKRAHWYSRLVLAVGEPIDIRARYSAMPSFVQMDAITQELFEQEALLKKLAEGESNK